MTKNIFLKMALNAKNIENIQKIFESKDFNDKKFNIFKIMAKYNIDNLQNLNYLKEIQNKLLIDACKLSIDKLDNKGNKVFKWSKGEKRGGFDYTPPPEGWKAFGINVLNKYENNDWLGNNGNQNEWPVAYHGVGIPKASKLTLENVIHLILEGGFKPGDGQEYENDDDERHPGKKIGRGVYCSPDPKVMEEYARNNKTSTCIEGRCFIVGIMMRVRPDKIRYSKDKDNHWVLDGTFKEMRPYRILIKEKYNVRDLLDIDRKKQNIENNHNDKDNNKSPTFSNKFLKRIPKKNIIIPKSHSYIGSSEWIQFVDKYLVNCSIFGSHTYENALSEAGIFGANGITWVRTGGLDVKKEEIKNLNIFFLGNPYSFLIALAGKKYRVISHFLRRDNFIYLKIYGGGATVCKTELGYVIGVYYNKKNLLYDGKKYLQNIGVCNTLVENCASVLRSQGY